jgi:16S rRNA U516 pseudouridylate synthase RsuA-like enzyme
VLLDDGPANARAVRRAKGAAVDVVMGEGRKRVVRRLFAAVGSQVVDLCRIAVGPIALGDLAEGASRTLDTAEVGMLHDAVRPAGTVGG